ncbi:MAG: ATP-dependent helicase [Anaerolineae bacterium]
MDPVLDGLNQGQREAVTAPLGPILVVAGPGSGKTRVLTHRVAYLRREANVSPRHMMAVTFTNKAAREMMERLYRLLGYDMRRLTIGTFHAICARMLRREGESHPLGSAFAIYDRDDQMRLMTDIIQGMGLDPQAFRPAALLSAISQAKSDLIPPAEFSAPNYWLEVARRAFVTYQEALAANRAMDFDDLLVNAVRLLEDEEVLGKYQRWFQHVLVDEFQDTNIAQYELVRLLCQDRQFLFAVGDEDQSIYGWRGADSRNIQRLREDFPKARIVLLERNYRSTQIILDAAQAVIRRNPDRVEKTLWTDASGGHPIALIEAYNEEEEAQIVLGEIQRLVAAEGFAAAGCAVMYRTNAQSRALEEAFVRQGIPYRLVGATRFYERREVKDIVAYLRVIHNPEDALSLLRILRVPRRGIGRVTEEALVTWAHGMSLSPYPALRKLASIRDEEGSSPGSSGGSPIGPRPRGRLLAFLDLLDGLTAVRDDEGLLGLFDAIVARTGYEAYLRDGTEEGEERWAQGLELRAAAQEYSHLPPGESLTAFLERVALVSDVDNLEEGVDAPVLLTLHMAKGLEFPVVFLIGLEEEILPHSRSLIGENQKEAPNGTEEETFEDPEALAEERRLLYVGMTRAQERLYLLHAFRRARFGRSTVGAPSRFLLDIPAHLLETPSGEPPDRPPSRARQKRAFKAGDKVQHAQFGKGLVVSSKMSGDDEEVTVVFEGMPPKRLLAGMAPLQKTKSDGA